MSEVETHPFSGKIKVGDWVRGELVHTFIPGRPQWIGIVCYINPDGDILHVQNPIDSEDKRVIGMKYVLEHVPKKEV